MRKTLLTATALAALLASPVLAQDATAPAVTPAVATAPTAAPTAPATAPAPTIAPAPKFLGQQSPDEILASNLIGATIYDPSNQDLGKVNDVILTQDGKVDAIVIGVGGFLGMGQKNVAVQFSAMQQTTDQNGAVKLVLDSTKDELNAAPAYVTVAMLKQQQIDQQNSMNAQQPAPTSTD